jgi:hypothetical protein
VGSELGGAQISTLLETLPGIANVLRSPVADALLSIIRAASRIGEFHVADAEELIRYAIRRGLVGQEEGERVLADVHEAQRRRSEKERMVKGKSHPKPKPKARPKAAKRASGRKAKR